ncbi:MAG TPA: FAD:protein FMN transferase [Gemmataceae bacterium]|jgi:thiamine biosynthesis lipoprotein|nr:FAD:protein FMN transferase [Gemmataceae bacterium]
MNRRDFLHPRHVAHAAGQLIGTMDSLETLAVKDSPGEEFTLLRFARRAMATTFEILLPFGIPNGVAIAETALNEINRLEAQLTVYRDDSEMSFINRTAYAEPAPVEKNLFELLQQAEQISAETGGAFDVTTGPLIKAWGDFRRRHRLPPAWERMEVLKRVGMKHVRLDDENRTVRYGRPGMEINLGSIGKGYALDRVADLLRNRWNMNSALVHGGHSSVYALGSEPAAAGGWSVGIRHPWDSEKRVAVIRLRDQALGTSAATFQHWEYEGRRLGHIIDPRTGWPAEGMASASVIAPTAAEADALATAFYILGVDKAQAYCDAHPDIGAVLLPQHEELPVVIGIAHEI